MPLAFAQWLGEEMLVDDFAAFVSELLDRQVHGDMFAAYLEQRPAPSEVVDAVAGFGAYMDAHYGRPRGTSLIAAAPAVRQRCAGPAPDRSISHGWAGRGSRWRARDGRALSAGPHRLPTCSTAVKTSLVLETSTETSTGRVEIR